MTHKTNGPQGSYHRNPRRIPTHKNTRSWTRAELRDLDKMARNDRQNYVVAEVKAVANIEFAPVLAKLQAVKRTQQVTKIRPLSAAGAIGCDATKNAIALIEQIPNISYIKWDKPVPLEEIIDGPRGGAGSVATPRLSYNH